MNSSKQLHDKSYKLKKAYKPLHFFSSWEIKQIEISHSHVAKNILCVHQIPPETKMTLSSLRYPRVLAEKKFKDIIHSSLRYTKKNKNPCSHKLYNLKGET